MPSTESAAYVPIRKPRRHPKMKNATALPTARGCARRILYSSRSRRLMGAAKRKVISASLNCRPPESAGSAHARMMMARTTRLTMSTKRSPEATNFARGPRVFLKKTSQR